MPKSDCGVGLLIGYNSPKALTPREVIPSDGYGPFAQKTDLGWGIIGLIRDNSNSSAIDGGGYGQIVLKTTAKEMISPQEVYKFFGREEGSCDDGKFSQDDVKFMKLMDEGVTKTADKHYQMPLPFRDSNVTPANNKFMAVQRLKALTKRFRKDPKHWEQYVKVIKGLVDKGYAELVPESELNEDTVAYYLPHHGVYNPNKPGKLRVVMDASAKFQDSSLNDMLLSGPDLMNGLVGVLCRFRQNTVAFMCDIEGMFHQFRVNPEHRNFLRFFWFKNDNYDEQMLILRSTVHLFGAVSSPAVANYGLKKAASDNEERYGSIVVKFFHKNFYVDDGLISLESESEAIDLIQASRALCQESGLHLHKFISNSRKVLETVPAEDRSDTVKELDLTHDPLPMERELGVRWCIESDFRVYVDKDKSTRRGILSRVCSKFNPLGFIAPIVLQCKLIILDHG